MPHYLEELLDEAESEQLEKKSSLDPSNAKEMLGLVADLVAMSNTKGDRLLIGTLSAKHSGSSRPAPSAA
jgi:predicted HTH transcriptional regulator